MNKKKNTRPGTLSEPARDGFADWTKERQAAHLAAFQEVQRKGIAELADDLRESVAPIMADCAGDMTCHDAAMPDLMAEAAVLRAARLLHAAAKVAEDLQNLSARLESIAACAVNDDKRAEEAEGMAGELRQLVRELNGKGGRP